MLEPTRFLCIEAIGGDDSDVISVTGEIRHNGMKYDISIYLQHDGTTANGWEHTDVSVYLGGEALNELDVPTKVMYEVCRAVGYYEAFYEQESNAKRIYHVTEL